MWLRQDQAARGGGAAGEARRHSPDSSPAAHTSITRIAVGTSTRGGGNAAPAANHSATMPPQASMARSVTDLVLGSACGGWSTGISSGFDSSVVGVAASE